MSLRRSILTDALAHIPRHSFTRQALLCATPQPELLASVVGEKPERALVSQWAAEGLRAMGEGRQVFKGKSQRDVDFEAVKRALERRIRWSSDVREHLVQAHALLATPEKDLSARLPRPLTALVSTLGSRLRLDPPYVPPCEQPSPSQSPSATFQSSSTTAPTLTLPLLNPLPLLSYAFKIADEALYVSGAEPETQSGELDWYTRRLGLAMIYLHAESHLLHPRPANTPTDPQLPRALQQLEESMTRYRRISEVGGRVKDVEREVGRFGWFVWKSWGGLFRSRGWIN